MAEKHDERAALFACAEIVVQEPALIKIRLFSGQELEIDITPYQFKSAQEAGSFLIDLLSKSMQDVMILANLRPVRPKFDPKPWGCKNAVRSQDTHIHRQS